MKNLRPFDGQHCETTATGTLLAHIGIELSEPMLFGLGGGRAQFYLLENENHGFSIFRRKNKT